MKYVVPFLMFLTLMGCSSTATDLQGRIKRQSTEDDYIMVCKTWGATKHCSSVLRSSVKRDLQALFPNAS